jgi:hypothetical protein
MVICISRPRNQSLTYREKNCRRGRLRPRQDNHVTLMAVVKVTVLGTRSARFAYGKKCFFINCVVETVAVQIEQNEDNPDRT